MKGDAKKRAIFFSLLVLAGVGSFAVLMALVLTLQVVSGYCGNFIVMMEILVPST